MSKLSETELGITSKGRAEGNVPCIEISIAFPAGPIETSSAIFVPKASEMAKITALFWFNRSLMTCYLLPFGQYLLTFESSFAQSE